MKILPNGYFSIIFSSEDLARGLRASDKVPNNTPVLLECVGAVGQDGILATLDPIIKEALMDSSYITKDDFPFPQLFILDKHVILCNRTSILELQNGEFKVMISGLTSGGKWNIAASYDFVYLTNDQVAVIKDPATRLYALSTTAPVGSAVCNFNGQIIVGVSS